MRLRILSVIAGGLLAGTLFAPAASGNTFPDLPGMRVAERVIGGRTLSTGSSGGTSSHAEPPADDRTASAPVSVASDQEATAPASSKSVQDMPANGGLPIVGRVLNFDIASAHVAGLPFGLLLLAALVLVCFTRFLHRLNRI